VSQAAKLPFDVLYQIILPIFMILSAGFVVGRKLHPVEAPHASLEQVSRRRHNVPASGGQAASKALPTAGQTDKSNLRVLSYLVFYVFTPCLAFSSLVTSEVDAKEVSQITLFALTMTLTMGVLAWTLTRLLRLSSAEASSLLLVTIFGNVGNYGLPLNQLAFGQQGGDRAIVYMTVSATLVYSLGILIAAHTHSKVLSRVLFRVMRIPIVYALLLAGLVRLDVLPVPSPILKATLILGQGAVPLMLLILGTQLSSVQMRGNWRLVGLVSAVRLLLAPFIAISLAGLMGLTGLTHQVSIIEASMPSAVFTTILAIEFDLTLDLITGVVFVTTLISPATLIPLISFLS
jgi:predicted permease